MQPRLVVLHYTAMHSATAAIQRLCDPVYEVSAHYVISKSGAVTQLVAEKDRAWHAGRGQWLGQDDINSRSIGIELDNRGDEPFAELQMQALYPLLGGMMQRWGIQPEGVIGHSDLAPGRKIDPGPCFDWAELGRRGLAAENPIAPETEEDFDSYARRLGYTGPEEAATKRAAILLRWPDLVLPV